MALTYIRANNSGGIDMRRAIVVGLVGAGLGLAASVASAQGYGGNNGNAGNIRCESQDGRTQRCNTGNAQARLSRQLSGSPCIEGRTWGNDNGSVWVSQGCRAEFVLVDRGYGRGNGYNNPGYNTGGYNNGSGQTFRCESDDGRNRQCAANGGNIRLVRQLSSSPCVEGRTWGQSGNGVWVSGGCRGEFQSMPGRGGGYGNGYGNGGGQVIRCESSDTRTKRCAANVRRGVQLQRQLSASACIEGRTWGSDGNGVWVSGGCRGEFAIY